MTTNNYKEYINYALIGLGAYFLLKFIRVPKNLPGGGGATYNPPIDATISTITGTEANAIAQKQYSAMADLGTNEDLLFASLRNLNGADLIKVYNAFGTKNYAASGSWFGIGYPLDLFGWYTEELGSSDLAKMRSIWRKSGLNITF